VIDSAEVKRLGREAGFGAVRICSADDLEPEGQRYQDWISAGRQSEMRWITMEYARRSSSPRTILPGARSVISVALAYWGGTRPEDGALRGRIARYAWGADYHRVLGERLRAFSDAVHAQAGAEHRCFVDTGPAMDKAFAARSGVGWQGKNTNILTTHFGSFVLLGEILTTLALSPDRPLTVGCGSCRLCIVACPTGALGPEYSIDSRRCISYLTIEHRGSIPRALRPAIGQWVFGCDICQDVCPPSAKAFHQSAEERRAWAAGVRSALRPEESHAEPQTLLPRAARATVSGPLYSGAIRPSVDLLWLLSLSHEEYVTEFRGTAIRRAKVWMLRRNAAIALGNVGDGSCVSGLTRAAREDEHPVVRGHAAWALGQVAARTGGAVVAAILRELLQAEDDMSVIEEIGSALDAAGRRPSSG
jgi:epoxyqueuosine reductase